MSYDGNSVCNVFRNNLQQKKYFNSSKNLTEFLRQLYFNRLSCKDLIPTSPSLTG